MVSSLFLQVAYYAFLIYWYNTIKSDLNSPDGLDVVAQTASYLAATNAFTKWWCEVFIFLVLTRFAGGIAIALKHKHAIVNQRIFKIGTYVVAGVLFVLSVVSFALSCNFFSIVLSHGITPDYLASSDYLWRLAQKNQMAFATTVIFFVAALSILALAIVTVVDAAGHPKVPKAASNYLLVSAALFVLQTAYDMANLAYYTDFSGATTGRPYQTYSEILEIVFNWWPLFIILTLLFSIGFLRREGLFSKHQSWMEEDDERRHARHSRSHHASNATSQVPSRTPSSTQGHAWPPQHYNKEKVEQDTEAGLSDLRHAKTAS